MPEAGINLSALGSIEPELNRAILRGHRIAPGRGFTIPLCNCQSWPPAHVTNGPFGYSTGPNAACQTTHPLTPNGLGEYSKDVYSCPNGKYYLCHFLEGSGCTNLTDTKPTCPMDTCAPPE